MICFVEKCVKVMNVILICFTDKCINPVKMIIRLRNALTNYLILLNYETGYGCSL